MPSFSDWVTHYEPDFSDGTVGQTGASLGNLSRVPPYPNNLRPLEYVDGPGSDLSVSIHVSDSLKTVSWRGYGFDELSADSDGGTSLVSEAHPAESLVFQPGWTVEAYWLSYLRDNEYLNQGLTRADFDEDVENQGGEANFRNNVISRYDLDPETGAGTGYQRVFSPVTDLTLSFAYRFNVTPGYFNGFTVPIFSCVSPPGVAAYPGVGIQIVPSGGDLTPSLSLIHGSGTTTLGDIDPFDNPTPTRTIAGASPDWFRISVHARSDGTVTVQQRTMAGALVAEASGDGVTPYRLWLETYWGLGTAFFDTDSPPYYSGWYDTRVGDIAADLTISTVNYDVIAISGTTTVVRQYPRDDQYGLGSAPRIHPPPMRSRLHGGLR